MSKQEISDGELNQCAHVRELTKSPRYRKICLKIASKKENLSLWKRLSKTKAISSSKRTVPGEDFIKSSCFTVVSSSA